jgi:hypothetical protein
MSVRFSRMKEEADHVSQASRTSALRYPLRSISPPKAYLAGHASAAHDRVGTWFFALDHLAAEQNIEGRRLLRLTRNFAASSWAPIFIEAEWSDADLFALDGGLIPILNRPNPRFAAIREDEAVFIGIGAKLEHFMRPHSNGVPWWEDARTIGKED